MNIEILILLIALQVKHWWVDFVIQTTTQVNSKGNYGEMHGIMHSVEHGVLTTAVFSVVVPIYVSLFIGIIDIILHYHIDWIKMNYGNRDIQNKKFWRDLGLDQLFHQLCYIGYISIYSIIFAY